MIPFWSLNDKLEDRELEEQIERMKAVGINGFFLHARGGLKTEYMSEEWLDRMETCIKKADELGMQAWLYDENGWPSGFGDGVVPALGEAFQQKALHYTFLRADDALPDHLLGLYRLADGKVTPISEREEDALAMYYTVDPYYVDLLSRDVTDSFIQNVHEKYYARLKPYFDGRICGFFTDEPQYARGDIPWSEWIRRAWQDTYGEDMLGALPLLFFDAEGCGEYRYRFYSIANRLIVHNYLEPIFNWCAAHNCRLTGHMMLEDTLISQIMAIGAAMPCYEYFQMPGIDHLTRCVANPLLPRQLSSAAAQFGRPTITETFAGCGWDVSLRELKWIAEWQYVNGVTNMCQHLQGYTLRGLRKRDWPASLFIQLPWFEDGAYEHFNHYFTALGEELSRGESAADILLLHPIKSAYMGYRPDAKAGDFDIARFGVSCDAYTLNDEFLATVKAMCDKHILYHLGDEDILAGHGQVTANGLQVGKCTYRAVVLPHMITLTESTYRLLMQFAEEGGKIYAVGDLPDCIEGKKDPRINDLNVLIRRTSMSGLKSAIGNLWVSENARDCDDLHYNCRRLEDGKEILYFTNLAETARTVKITLSGIRRVCRRNLADGSVTPLAVSVQNGETAFSYAFDRYGDLLIETEPADEAPQAPAVPRTVQLPLTTKTEVVCATDNALTLDYCEWRVDGGEWQPATYVLRLQEYLTKLGRPCDIEMRFSFDVRSLAGVTSMAVAAECPDQYTFTVNGKPYTFTDEGYYIDKSFRRSDILPLVKEGKNEIVMSGRFSQKEKVYELFNTPGVHESVWNKLTLDSEIESIYIVGQFGTVTDTVPTYGKNRTVFGGDKYAITSMPKTVDTRMITEDGFWFFSGKIKLAQTVSIRRENGVRYALTLKDLHAPASRVYVNGKAAAFLEFAPFTCDVTDLVRDGDNTVEIVLYSGNRNALGPHHARCGEYYCVSPDMFRSDTSFREDEGRPVGWTDAYNFVTFGFEV